MSMLAENKRKSKWVINPTKKPIWSTDSNGIKFGKQLMEKMGWSAGKGLGLNEQGIQEPLKVSFKNDTKGMGFKGNDDDWIEHQDEFNILLNQLRSNDDSSASKDSIQKNEIKSLEEKSKQSKARVHYQKFTRGKDLSRYSENDLASILGSAKTKKKDLPKIEEVIESETKINGYETSFGVTTINSGSINDYFKKKWTAKPSDVTVKADDEEENYRPSFSSGKSCTPISDEISVKWENNEEKATTKKKHKSLPEKISAEENRTCELNETESTDRVEKRKRKKQEISWEQEGPDSKKRRNNCNDAFENSSNDAESLSLVGSCSPEKEKEKKKDRNYRKSKRSSDFEVESSREKERANPEDSSTEESVQVNRTKDGAVLLEEESGTRKKKKKEKKEKLIGCQNMVNNCDKSEDLDESALEIKAVSYKKQKKQELEKSEENDGDNQSSPSTEQVEDWEVSRRESNGDNTLKMGSGKKKRKKDKKESLREYDDTNVEVSYVDDENSNNAQLIVRQEIGSENTVELELGKKKNKKKTKKGKPDDSLLFENGTNQIEEFCMEGTSEKIITNYEEKTTVGDESVKKKKKKKDKKEKHESKSKESFAGERKVEEESILNVDLNEKKKKKKHKKERKEHGEGIENKEEQDDEEIRKEKGLGGPDTQVKGDSNPDAIAQDRLQKLSGSLFPDKAAAKYFPEQGTNERVLKLIRWANIAQFKGSNLSDLEGYGRRKMYQKQSREENLSPRD